MEYIEGIVALLTLGAAFLLVWLVVTGPADSEVRAVRIVTVVITVAVVINVVMVTLLALWAT